MKTSKCSTCGAPVAWVLTILGRKMPIDPEPVPDGNLLLQDGIVQVCKVEKPTDGSQVPLYKSHFATCAHAKLHRVKR